MLEIKVDDAVRLMGRKGTQRDEDEVECTVRCSLYDTNRQQGDPETVTEVAPQ